MGLDLVEFIMAVEKEFGITIDDNDAESIQTVGQFCAYVELRLAGALSSKSCSSSHFFYRLRRGLVEIAGVPRQSIKQPQEIRSTDRIPDFFPYG